MSLTDQKIGEVLKQLYIDFQFGGHEGLDSSEMVKSCYVNLKIEPKKNIDKKTRLAESLRMELQNENEPRFHFVLIYNDSMAANFDPTMTLLNKAYNLQHVDLSVQDSGHKDLTIDIILCFPAPYEYGNLTEYDIYGLFTEKVRGMPLLRESKSIKDAEFGLTRCKNNGTGQDHEDCFIIRMCRKADSTHHHAWLPADPGYYFKDFIKFKTNILAHKKDYTLAVATRNIKRRNPELT